MLAKTLSLVKTVSLPVAMARPFLQGAHVAMPHSTFQIRSGPLPIPAAKNC